MWPLSGKFIACNKKLESGLCRSTSRRFDAPEPLKLPSVVEAHTSDVNLRMLQEQLVQTR